MSFGAIARKMFSFWQVPMKSIELVGLKLSIACFSLNVKYSLLKSTSKVNQCADEMFRSNAENLMELAIVR